MMVYPNELVEMVLAHVVASKTEAPYRRGDMFERHRRLMDAWAALCASSPREGQVLPISGGGHGALYGACDLIALLPPARYFLPLKNARAGSNTKPLKSAASLILELPVARPRTRVHAPLAECSGSAPVGRPVAG